MKIKLNTRYPDHNKLVERLSQELPELIIRSKEREWGLEKPSFKFKKSLYEFDDIEELVKQAKKILKMTDKDFATKTVMPVEDVDPDEMGEIRPIEELVLEIPVEKYNLNDLNIKLRLGSHQEKSSTYESEKQTLHYEVLEDASEDTDASLQTDEPEISMTSINNDIVLDIPSEKYNLNDLNLNIKFTQYGETNSTYEVKKKEEEKKKAKKAEEDMKP